MDFEAYLGSKYQLPTQVAGDIMHPASSDILFQDGMLSPTVVTSHVDSSFGYLSHPTGVSINHPYFESSMEQNVIISSYRSASSVMDGSYWTNRLNSSVNLPSSSLAVNSLRGDSSLCLDHLLVPQQLSQAVQCQSEQCEGQRNNDLKLARAPRLEFKEDDLFLQYLIHQLLLSESSKQYTNNDPKLAASYREYQVLNALQKETIPSISKPLEGHC